MKKLSLSALVSVVLGISSQASAAWAPSGYRCSFDSLSNDQGWGRQQWAKRCTQQNPYSHPSTRDSRFWHSAYTPEANDYALVDLFPYPVYTDPSTYEAWRGPGAAGSPTAGYTGAQIAALPCTIKPAQIFMDGICEPRIFFNAAVPGQDFQSEHVSEVNRLGLRLDVPEDVIPGH